MDTVIDTPEGIEYVRLLSIIGRLKIEIGTGMRSRVNTLQAAQRTYGLYHLKSRKRMLEHLEVVRDCVKYQDEVLYPVGDGTVGLYAREELGRELALRRRAERATLAP